MPDYTILAKVRTDMSHAELREALQIAYDDGAEGSFDIRKSGGDEYLLVFQRDSGFDHPYISARLKGDFTDEKVVQRAVVDQLAAELSCGSIPNRIADHVRQTGWVPFLWDVADYLRGEPRRTYRSHKPA